MKHLLAVAAVVILAACARPSTNNLTLADCGPMPDQASAEKYVSDAVSSMEFRDPGSVQISDVRIVRPTAYQGVMSRIPIAGWLVYFRVNAKNGYGGYTGPRPFLLIHSPDGRQICSEASDWQLAD
jgi:hypothetical protein